MRTTPAFVGLDCVDCGARADPETTHGRCPDCGGILDPAYDLEAVGVGPGEFAGRADRSMWRYEELLPFPRSAAVTMDEGGTALVDCPRLADRMGVGRVLLKDEGRNPTGTFKDRGQSAAVTAAVEHGAETIALSSAGNAGQAAAAYAARAGLDAHVFLPTRAGFTQKAGVELHGATLHEVGPMRGGDDGGAGDGADGTGDTDGTDGADGPGAMTDGATAEIGDAGDAYAAAMAENDWYSVKTFVTPYRHEGKKTMALELFEALDWTAPDAVVYPTGGGVGLVGMDKAARECRRLGWIDERPGLYAAQASGCAPIVEAYEAGRTEHEPWDDVRTACNGIAIPDPGASRLVLESVRESGGGAVAAADRAILDAAVTVAREEGLEMGATCAAAAAGAFDLADRGAFGPDDTVVLLNTGAGNKDADALRAHLGERAAGD